MTKTLRPRLKYRTRKIAKFGGKAGNPSGQSGSRYLKKHLRAQGLPGTPQGTCIAQREANKPAKHREKCYCGTHNAEGGV